MRNLILSSLILVGMLGCAARIQVRDVAGKPLNDYMTGKLQQQLRENPTESIFTIENTAYGTRPKFAYDGLPNSEVQVKAYESAINRTSQAGHWFGGFFFGLPYAVGTHFFQAHPPISDFKNIPADSAYWYARYYNQEVSQIRSLNAWWGFGTRVVVGITTYLIVRSILNNASNEYR